MSIRNDTISNGSSRSKNRRPRSSNLFHAYEQKYLNQLENEARKLSIESNEIKLKKRQKNSDERDVTKTILEFFGSIPEYTEVNHLSNKDFYKKLENLKEKQKQYTDYLQREMKLANRDSEWVNDYQLMKIGSKALDTKCSTPKSKPFCTTPILTKKSKNCKNFEDVDIISLSDKETKPSSRRSVRIETPMSMKSMKSSSNSSPELFKRPKSAILSSPSPSMKESNEWSKLSDEEMKIDTDIRKNLCSPVPKKVSQDEENCGITIPKPFQMTVRDEENQIVEKCLSEMKVSKKKEKPEMFKAHSVPIKSQIPLFDKIMADQEYKNHLVRERRKAEILSQMRPFSFTDRDEEIQAISKRLSKSSPCIFPADNTEEVKQFKAKPVPKNLFSNYIYHKMYEDEFYRSLQKKIRSAEMLKASSLPPSMAKREQHKKIYDVCPKSYKTMVYDEEFPEFMRTKRIPDFQKFHDRYDKELEELKNEFISTSPRPFKFRRSKSKCKKDKATSSTSSSRTNSASGLRAISRSNLAAVLRIESARKRLRDHMDQKLEEARLKEEARWREKIMRKKPIWQALAFTHEEDLAMRLRLRKEEDRLRKEEHRLRMELMFGRVNQQPTLFERQSLVKFPANKEEVLDTIYKEYAAKPRRSISDLSCNYYYNDVKGEGTQVDANEFKDCGLTDKEMHEATDEKDRLEMKDN
ncbi:hypothetical protein WA026_022412 [Henosepilachna vigintioctopunctata]|uniref:Protein FAM161A n=1 Tax=Henosepilachna vigintioctopunctata TaxID=420089 RepID=A0AAW1U456_9CUCU